jgi:class 3 adenylate cyclase/pimeloyl-ACP methyl ester carboxylesterase
VEIPDVQYARSGDVAIAYQVVGEGPIDLVFFRSMAGDVLSTWDHPLSERHVEGLASFSRVLMLDKRGTGLSDRVREVPTLETRMDDVRAVMDAVGSEKALLWSGHEGTRMAILFAATYPERTAGLMLLDPSVRGLRAADYPWAPTEEEWRRRIADVREGWGNRGYFLRLLGEWAPTVADDKSFQDWFVEHMRRSMSPGAALAFFRTMMEADIRDVLPSVRVPTLLLCRTSERGEAEYIRERIAGAELVELPGLRGLWTWIPDDIHERTIGTLAAFARGIGDAREPDRVLATREPDRVLATVLFTDIVDSTPHTVELGDAGWRELLERHHSVVRSRLGEFRGRELDTAGDGFFAAFDGPGRAIACARAIVDDLHPLGLGVRAGLHTGEFERLESKLTGIGVAVGARVAAEAAAGEVLVSGTVKDLVAGSGLEFEDRGSHELKGVPGEWRLYAVRDS